jgi:DNA anti-recombination protein RmuC
MAGVNGRSGGRRAGAGRPRGPDVLRELERIRDALLHCVRVGHLTLALEQKAGVIGEILGAVKTEWAKLRKSLDVLARRAATLSNGIRDTRTRSRAIGRTLRTIDMLDPPRAEQLLGVSDDPILVERAAMVEDEEDLSGETEMEEAFDPAPAAD